MMVMLNITMKNGERYSTRLPVRRDDLAGILDERQFLRLDYPDAFALLNVAEVASLTVSEVKGESCESP